MSESKDALPIDERIWDLIAEVDGTVGIKLGSRTLDLMGALYDIYFTIKSNQKEGLELLTGLAALLMAGPSDRVDEVWEELIVKESLKNFELRAQEVLDEKQE